MAKYLIVNADDYGMCQAANDAVEDLFRKGNIKSATIMMPCPKAEDAVRFSIDNPQYAIGIHLTMTSEWNTYKWAPLSSRKTLVDENGYMWKNSTQVGRNASYEDLEAEVRAQVDKSHALGMKPSHLDNHMGSLYGHFTMRFGLLKMTLRLCGEYGYAFRMFTDTDKRLCPAGVPYPAFSLLKLFSKHWGKKYNVLMPDYMLFPDWPAMNKKIAPKSKGNFDEDYLIYREEILKLWTDIPEGITETFIHPSLDTPELRSITGSWHQRVWEYRLMNDPCTHEYLEKHGITLISYRDLIKLKTK
ncbi:MAG: polysaccharide deacetylase family protein [Clostridia bacterium]|nr:polysaccharide deacetylase family protein [Clostridia bacterium]